MPGNKHLTAHLDHLVFAAADLAAGTRWLEDRTGLPMQPGGEHAYFGTHNALLGLSSGYIEMIAVNPQAPVPPHPRWFGLDTPEMQRRLSAGPALIHWVVTVPRLDAALRASPEDHGAALALSRGGNRWQLSVPADGSLPMGGVLPSLIQWESLSPAIRMQSQRLSVTGLRLSTPEPARLQTALDALGVTGVALDIEAGPPCLKATLDVEGRVVEF
jgi:hypothetical protein